MEGNDILEKLQDGFCKNKSCKTQLISLVYDLAHNLDQKLHTDIISIDFAKAFNTVPHTS